MLWAHMVQEVPWVLGPKTALQEELAVQGQSSAKGLQCTEFCTGQQQRRELRRDIQLMAQRFMLIPEKPSLLACPHLFCASIQERELLV